MSLYEHGKGYLLVPLEDSEYYGQKYFYNGWWMSRHNGWFFKASEYDWLDEHGAFDDTDDETVIEPSDDETVIEPSDDEAVIEPSVDLTSMSLYEHGKGYILVPLDGYENYGQKYFYNGWWMPSQSGWFFKADEYDWLNENGAFDYTDYETSVKNDNESGSVDLTSMTVEKYKKGYVLKTSNKDKRYGSKYFLNGFWNKNVNGWFFKKEYLDSLTEMGAKLIKTEDDIEKCEVVSDYKPNFVKYGKGYLLKEDSHYKFNKNYYLEDNHGWWVSNVKGWFFKSHQKDAFLTKYYS